MKVEFLEWGWVNSDGKPQTQTFEDPGEAIKEMQRRLGGEPSYERISDLGFKLCRVKVTLEVQEVLGSVS